MNMMSGFSSSIIVSSSSILLYKLSALQYRHSKLCLGAVLPNFNFCVISAVYVLFTFVKFVLSFLVLTLLPGLQALLHGLHSILPGTSALLPGVLLAREGLRAAEGLRRFHFVC